jgi:biopolymer transport protein ExbD
MAEILTAAKPGKRKKLNTRVDLTPMVDLGFLLITFFVFTSALSSPFVMELKMPADGPPTDIPESGAVTIIPAANKIWYYEGKMPATAEGMRSFSYAGKEALRLRLLQLRNALVQINGDDEKLMVMIKPAPSSNLGQLVEMLDEMAICDIRRFAIVDLPEAEQKMIDPTE